MVKKIRFPLEMDNGFEVRGMEELRDNFSLTRIVHYFENGKLLTWLKDRYEDELAREVEILDRSDKQFAQKISNIFGVPYNESEEDALEEELVRAKRLELLKKYTDDTSFMEKVNQIAFEQDELFDLLDENITTIYLCGDKFSIPLSKKGITYIGVNNPIIKVDSITYIDWNEKDIKLENIKFDDKYLEIVKTYEANRETNDEIVQEISTPSLDAEKLKKLYNKICEEIQLDLSYPNHNFSTGIVKTQVSSESRAEQMAYEDVNEDIEFIDKIFVKRTIPSFENLRREYLDDLRMLYNLYSEVFLDEKIDFSIVESLFDKDFDERINECAQLYRNENFYECVGCTIMENCSKGGWLSSKTYDVISTSRIPVKLSNLIYNSSKLIRTWYSKFKKDTFRNVGAELARLNI